MEDKEGLLQIQQARNHLLEKLDKLYDGLWDSICAKKDEGVEHRLNLIHSNWIEGEAAGMTDIAERLLQIELNRTTELIEFTINYLLPQNKQPIDDSNEHLLVESSHPDGALFPSIDLDSGRFPRLEQLSENVFKVIDTLPEWTACNLPGQLRSKGQTGPHTAFYWRGSLGSRAPGTHHEASDQN